MLFVNRHSSETIKYASNAFGAIKIHYINEMENFCEKRGGNINEEGMGFDSCIGDKFLKAVLAMVEVVFQKVYGTCIYGKKYWCKF